jgi:3-methyladenine DNA glycosylase/8-oxoguanine DNA glycosylase
MAERDSQIAELFPGLSEEERKEADEKLRRYFDFIFRLHDRLASLEKEADFGALTEEDEIPNIGDGRTFTNQYGDTE